MPHPITRLVPVVALLACNQPPAQPTVSITPAAPTTLDALTAVYEGAEDPNGDPVTVSLRWYRDEEAQPGLDDVEVVPIASTTKGQAWRVIVTPTDGSAIGDGGEATTTILNSPATVDLSIDPEAPSTFDVVRAVAEANDADRDNTTLRYEWSVNGSVTNIDSTSLPADRTEKGQVWEVSVSADDGEGEGEPATVSFTIENSVPSALTARITPSDPDKLSTLACEGDGWSDPDGDDEAYRTEWLVDGASASNDATLSGSTLSRGDQVQCVLTPDDGEGTGSPVASDVLVFGNTLPVLDSVAIGPEDPIASDVVAATLGTASDADGDAIEFRYSWRVDGTEVGTDETLASSRFYKGGEIQLRVTPSDALEDGAYVDSNVVIGGNNAPVADSVAIIPDPLYTADLAEADVVASDRDASDTLRIDTSWSVNGSVVASTATLDGDTAFDKGDTVSVTVQADDGDAKSAGITSATVTVSNSAPSAPELAWDTTEPSPDADLQCVVDVASTDDDSADTVSYSFRWELDGATKTGATTTTHTGDTMPSASWSDGDDLRCFVTATDGIDPADEVMLRLPIKPPCTTSKVVTDSAFRSFVLCKDKELFDDAVDECRSMGGSWDLVSVQSAAENTFLDTQTTAFGMGSSWIGYTDEDVEGTWEWTDGSTTTYHNFLKPEPNGGSAFNCAMFRNGSTYKGSWNDIKCGNALAYTCAQP